MSELDQIIIQKLTSKPTPSYPVACCGCDYSPESSKDKIEDVIAMPDEREAIEPMLSVDTWICSKCDHTLESQELIDDKENLQVLIHEQYEYCPCCGRKVKWNA